LKINPLAQRGFRGELLPGNDDEGIAAGRDRKVFTALRQNPSVGLYGVMSYSVSQRTKEIGVRMALGARAAEVQKMVVRGGMRLALLSIVLGLPLALAAAKLATSLLYGVQPWDVATFTLVPLLLIVVSLVACWIPSRRASRVDPMVALRSDG
jgi:ABC-type antimicrobial peptide transport system permease subunit